MLRAIIADENVSDRAGLRIALKKIEDVEVVAEAESVRSVIDTLKTQPCDVLFLDAVMPDTSSFILAKAVQKLNMPIAIVIVSTCGDYACDAFDVNAVDYLLKPIEDEQLEQAIERVRKRFDLRYRACETSSIAVTEKGKTLTFGLHEISYFKVHHDYSYLYADGKRYFYPARLCQLEKNLASQGFYRAHRSYLVNLSLVVELESLPHDELLLTVNGASEKVPVARRRISSLKKILGLRG